MLRVVRFSAEPARAHAVRVHIAHGTGQLRGVRAAAMVDEPRQPEVGVEGGVQHDVAGLDVPV